MDTSYPHLMFQAVRPLNDDEGEELLTLFHDPDFSSKVESVLAQGEFGAKAEDKAPEQLEFDFEEPPKQEAAKVKAPPKKKVASAPKPAPKEEPEEEIKDELDDELDSILSSLDNLD